MTAGPSTPLLRPAVPAPALLAATLPRFLSCARKPGGSAAAALILAAAALLCCAAGTLFVTARASWQRPAVAHQASGGPSCAFSNIYGAVRAIRRRRRAWLPSLAAAAAAAAAPPPPPPPPFSTPLATTDRSLPRTGRPPVLRCVRARCGWRDHGRRQAGRAGLGGGRLDRPEPRHLRGVERLLEGPSPVPDAAEGPMGFRVPVRRGV